MAGKELTFKLVMEADSKSFVTNIKQSEDVTKKVFATIKSEAEKVRVIDLVKDLHEATQEISNLGDKSSISANQIRDMSMQSQQKIGELKSELVAAQAELVRLSQSKAAPADIQNAINRVSDLENSINDVKSAFGAYEATALNAMSGVDKATNKTISEIQKFTSVDLTEIVTETQNVTRAIESMGDGASVSTKEVQRIGQLGTTAIDALEKELISARAAWKALADSSDDVTLEELTAAKQRVTGLESALDLTENSMKEFNQATQQAIPIVDNLDNSLDQTNQGLKDTETFTQRASGEIEGLKTGFNTLTGVLGALGIGVTAGEIAQTADEFKSLSGRVNIAIGEHGNLQKAMDDVKNVAIATNSNLSATGDLYSRLTKIGQEMKWPQEQALALTETINKAVQVGGGNAASTEAAITQLNQALGSGVLRGDEFNSMAEQSPRLTQAMADGLGVTTGQLREMANQGQLTTDVVTKALLSQSEIISAEFAKFPTTIGASIENLKTAWTIYIGEADAANGVSAKVADAIKFVAENLDILVTTLTTVAQAYIAYKAIGMAAVFLEKANAIRGAQLAIAAETTSIVANTQAQIANTGASTAAALAKTQLATATSASTAANTAAAGGFGKVTTAVGGLKTGLVSVLSRFGAYGAAAAGVVIAGDLVITSLKKVDEWLLRQGSDFIDWSVSKITGTKSLVEQEKEYIATEEASRKKQEEVIAAKAKNTERTEMLKNASLGLNEASKATVLAFDKQIEAGSKVSEALEGVANSFNFDSTTGINNGITALLALQTQGKASGEEIRKALTGVLKDEDLVAFQGRLAAIPINIEKQIEATNVKIKAKQEELNKWKKANSDLNEKDWNAQVEKYRRGIETLQAEASALHVQYANSVKGAALVLGAVLDEAIHRTGLSYEELSGKSTKAFTSAINDVTILINNLEDLKSKGVDVGRALDASISNAINTASNQKELDELKLKINSLRNILGEKVTDGLLRQAEQQLIDIKDKSDQARAGINSVQEAFNLFGMKTPAQLKIVAQDYKAAFDEMKKSGQATLSQQQEAFKQYAEKAIAANKGVADSIILNEAASLGLKVEVDATGKASVKSMDALGAAVTRAGNSFKSIEDGARSAGGVMREEAKSASDAWQAAVEKSNKEFKAEMKRQGESLSKGIYNYSSYSKEDVLSQLKSKGYSDDEANKLAGSIWSEAMAADRDAKAEGLGKDGSLAIKALINQEFDAAAAKGLTTQWGTNKINDLLRQVSSNNLVSTGPSTKPVDVNSLAPNVNAPVPNTTASPTTRTVQNNISINGKTISIPVAEENQSNFNDFLSELEMLKKGM